jgi:hypothetical protein
MSFVNSLRQAVETSPRVDLHKVQETVWKTWGAGGLSDKEAEDLANLIEARKVLPAPQKPVQRRVGSRPRSPASMERRRSWAACGAMPPQLAARFTLGEVAVLAVVAAEVRTKGSCSLTIGHIAALAGVCRKTVKNALREAEALGFVRVEERRLTAWRNAPNRVTITSPEWHAWMRIRRRGVGVKAYPPRIPEERKGAPSAQRAANKRVGLRSELRRGRSSPAFSSPAGRGGWRTR